MARPRKQRRRVGSKAGAPGHVAPPVTKAALIGRLGAPLKSRYVVLCLVVFSMSLFQTTNGQWYGDFWEHGAVVRELATHPIAPRHPQLLTDAPHEFFSPYALVIACVSRITGLGPVGALSFAGLFNLVFLLISLRLFVSRAFHREATSFYGLLFILVLWGSSPWKYSGFLHLDVLGAVLPYPSSFAAALFFFSLWTSLRFLESQRPGWLLVLLLVSVVVLLTHPITALAVFVGLVALALGPSRAGVDRALLVAVIPVSLLLASVWPYFPFLELILHEGAVYHGSNRVMYAQVLEQTLPGVIGLVALLWRVRLTWRDPLVLMFGGLGAIWAYGGLSGQWSYGRVIAYMMVVVQLALADEVARIESGERFGGSKRLLRWFGYGIVGASVLLAVLNLGEGLKRSIPGQQNWYSPYAFLSQHTEQYDVILSDILTSWPVPTFGGKIVATVHPLAFVRDHDARLRAVDMFPKNETSASERVEILRRYGVRFVLVNQRDRRWAALVGWLEGLGRRVYSGGGLVLIELDEAAGRTP